MASDPIVAVLYDPSAARIGDERRKLAEKWRRSNDSEPFDIVTRRGFDAKAGDIVVRMTCGPTLPGSVKWEGE